MRTVKYGNCTFDADKVIRDTREKFISDNVNRYFISLSEEKRKVKLGEVWDKCQPPKAEAAPQGPTVAAYAKRIAAGETLTSAEDLQFYESNKRAIDREVAKLKKETPPQE